MAKKQYDPKDNKNPCPAWFSMILIVLVSVVPVSVLGWLSSLIGGFAGQLLFAVGVIGFFYVFTKFK